MSTALDLGSRRVSCPVESFTEWDPLEEVVVGILDGATVPAWDVALLATMPADMRSFYETHAGKPFPPERVAAGQRDLAELVRVLEGEGVRVVRPQPVDFGRPIRTVDWETPAGLYAAMPRDCLLVVGNTIIEAPMAWRSRYCETFAYRELLTRYFREGARWLAAPRPRLSDLSYNPAYAHDDPPGTFAITEAEPLFDAADFLRFGADLVVQKSHVTNGLGIDWVRQALGPEYRVHEVGFDDPHAMHIDATIMPLAPGKLLVNPERASRLPALFRRWDLLPAPLPVIPVSHPLYMTSRWINMNLLPLDERRVLVEREDEPMRRALKRWGFEPIPCAFRDFNTFGGSFHCATLDVRRRGTAARYLD